MDNFLCNNSLNIEPRIAIDKVELSWIEAAADKILAEVGIKFENDPETLDLWRQAGARIVDNRVYLEGIRLRDTIRRNAPERFTLRGRNPARDTIIGQGSPRVLAPVYGAPNVLPEDGQRETGSLEYYHRFVSMAHTSSVLSNTGHMICVPSDIAEAARPLEMTLAHLRYSDKPFMGSIASPTAAVDVIDAVSQAVGRPLAAAECNLLHLINSTPPFTYKENPLKCLRAIALRREACMVTSYMMMGATSPVTVAGTLIQGYAEALAGVALTQLWSPGAPVIMGIFAIPFSMTSMLPCFGDPASRLVQMYAVALAHRLGIPARGDGGITSSKVDDAQAGFEGAHATSTALYSGADFILHSSGWLEQGRCVSVSKFKREAISDDESTPPLPLDPAIIADLKDKILNRSECSCDPSPHLP